MTEVDTTSSAVAPTVAEKGQHPLELLLKERGGRDYALKEGDLIEGTIMEKRGSRLFIDLKNRGTGIVYGREFYDAQNVIKTLKPGDRVSAKVVDLDNDDGFIELSLSEAGREKEWQEIKHAIDENTVLTLKVADANRGGLIINYKGASGFLPASQLSSEHYPRVDGGDKKKIFTELKKLVGTELQLKIIDANQEEGKLIFSEKTMGGAGAQEKLSAYNVGDTVEGEITGVVTFGAFVKFDEGLEGLVHISEIDWQLIENPTDVLKVGEKVKAKIIDISGDRVSLSLKALKSDPWLKAPERYKKGDLVHGKAVKYNPFGVFIKLDPEIQGLLHISEFGTEQKMREKIRLNEEYQLRILSVDAKDHRLALGLTERHPDKETREEQEEEVSKTPATEEPKEVPPAPEENPEKALPEGT
ncbi:MAG: S1 RNA-binding domain-containing protein [Candidatus Sungbacteria bacterium]|nr:S1 RNA-binding domain-containing protein [Candidatus Sungbacteria bacterium]